jgi:hypothetical protein
MSDQTVEQAVSPEGGESSGALKDITFGSVSRELMAVEWLME